MQLVNQMNPFKEENSVSACDNIAQCNMLNSGEKQRGVQKKSL